MKINTKKFLKKLKIKRIKCEYNRHEFIRMFGFIPSGYARAETKEIYLHRKYTKEVLFHEVAHILLAHSDGGDMWGAISTVCEMEANLVAIKVCKKFGEDCPIIKDYQKLAKSVYRKNKFKKKVRLTKIEKVCTQIIDAIERG